VFYGATESLATVTLDLRNEDRLLFADNCVNHAWAYCGLHRFSIGMVGLAARIAGDQIANAGLMRQLNSDVIMQEGARGSVTSRTVCLNSSSGPLLLLVAL
jgi:hypothetical protein